MNAVHWSWDIWLGLITDDTPTFGRQGSAGSSYLRWANLTKTLLRSVNCKSSNSGILNFKLVFSGQVLRSNQHMQHASQLGWFIRKALRAPLAALQFSDGLEQH